MELRDIEAVQEEAARSLADMARDAVRSNSRSNFVHDLAICDAAGPVLEVQFTFAIKRPKH